MEEFKDRLRTAIMLSDYKQAEVAERCGIPRSTLSEYLSGRYLAKQDNIYRLAHLLNVSEAWLMGYDVPKERIVHTLSDAALHVARLTGSQAASIDKNKRKTELTMEILDKVSAMNEDQLEVLNTFLRTFG